MTPDILVRPTHVAMATKFGTKSAITRPIYEISRRSLRITALDRQGLHMTYSAKLPAHISAYALMTCNSKRIVTPDIVVTVNDQ